MKKFYFFILAITLFTLKAADAFSQSGILDASFGTGGKVVTQTGDSSSVANTVVVTATGKILVGGYSFISGTKRATLIQYNSDGSIDTIFGAKGKVVILNLGASSLSNIALQPDNKIVAGGVANLYAGNFLVARFNNNGSLDSTFGNNGIATVSTPDSTSYAGAVVNKILIRQDGKIVAAGTLYTLFLQNFPTFTQYLANGVIDSSFGKNGTLNIRNTFESGVSDMAITADDKILSVLNESAAPVQQEGFFITKLLQNGNYDSSFGLDGVVKTAISNSPGSDGTSIVLLFDNSFVVTGSSYPGPPVYATSIALVKYHPDGSLDSTFGVNGKVQTSIPGSYAFSNRILSSPDGSLIVSGYAASIGKQDFLLAKYSLTGIPDSSFGTNGITTTDFSGTDDMSYSSALQLDGKIVLAGSTGSSTNYNIALARYNNSFIVPLHLLSFTAIKNESSNLLQWQTAQEINTRIYDVQRSAEGKNYNAIGYVNARNNNYSFTDKNPFAGSNYYRLKMIDNNGAFTYSPVRLISNSSSFTIKVYPNPAKSNLQLQIDNIKEAVFQWQVLSAVGNILLSDQWSAPAGSSTKSINIQTLSKGHYYLSVTTKNNGKSMITFEKL